MSPSNTLDPTRKCAHQRMPKRRVRRIKIVPGYLSCFTVHTCNALEKTAASSSDIFLEASFTYILNKGEKGGGRWPTIAAWMKEGKSCHGWEFPWNETELGAKWYCVYLIACVGSPIVRHRCASVVVVKIRRLADAHSDLDSPRAILWTRTSQP